MNQRENSADSEPFFLAERQIPAIIPPEGLHRDFLLSSKPASEAAYQGSRRPRSRISRYGSWGARMAKDISQSVREESGVMKEGRSSSRIKAVLLPDPDRDNRIDSFRILPHAFGLGGGTASVSASIAGEAGP